MALSQLPVLLRVNLRAAFVQRRVILITSGAMFAQNLLFFLIWVFFFANVKTVRGWTLADFETFYGIVVGGFGLMFLWADSCGQIARKIIAGDLDAYLVRPRHPLPSLLLGPLGAACLGDIAYAAILLSLAHLSLAGWGLALLTALLTGIIQVALFIIVQTLGFYLAGGDRLARQLYDMFLCLSAVPQQTQTGVLKLLLFTVVPAGFMVVLPVAIVRQHSLHLLLWLGFAAMRLCSAGGGDLQLRPAPLYLRYRMESVNLSPLVIAFRLGFRRVLAERGSLLGQLLIYGVLVISYNVLFHGIAPAVLARFGLNPASLVWYFVTTQIVVGCSYYHYHDLERDILRGGLETLLLRPYPFWATQLAEWAGQYTGRLGVIAPLGFGMALWAGNPLPPHFLLLLPLIFLSLWLGGVMFLGWHFMAGCAVLWTRQSEPVFRFWQKTLFFVGARSWPLLLYPLWAQALIWWTPFPAILAVPAGLLLAERPLTMAAHLGCQLWWFGGTLLACAGLSRLVRNTVQKTGA